VELPAPDIQTLDLPAGPVSDVSAVALGGTALVVGTDCFRVLDTLFRARPWGGCWPPVTVVVTYTHGYAAVPADIVDLVCALAGMAFAQDGEYGQHALRKSIHLGDYTEVHAHPAGEQPSPVAIPDGTRQRLRARFGTAVATIGMH
jgi:hypothetical protein